LLVACHVFPAAAMPLPCADALRGMVRNMFSSSVWFVGFIYVLDGPLTAGGLVLVCVCKCVSEEGAAIPTVSVFLAFQCSFAWLLLSKG
jgi:hypothetical protein